jgi:hypothetical protein
MQTLHSNGVSRIKASFLDAYGAGLVRFYLALRRQINFFVKIPAACCQIFK